MIITPFGGISIVVHLMVVAVKKIINNTRYIFKNKMRVVSLIILLLTFSAVFTGAYFILEHSFISDTSNAKIIGSFIDQPPTVTMTSAVSNLPIAQAEVASPTLQKIIPVTPPILASEAENLPGPPRNELSQEYLNGFNAVMSEEEIQLQHIQSELQTYVAPYTSSTVSSTQTLAQK